MQPKLAPSNMSFSLGGLPETVQTVEDFESLQEDSERSHSHSLGSNWMLQPDVAVHFAHMCLSQIWSCIYLQEWCADIT
jgi:hypothetical protein